MHYNIKIKYIEDGKINIKEFRIDESDIDEYTTILELLLMIRERYDPKIVLRYSCRMAMCGSCGMVINGKPNLACLTKVKKLGYKINIEPLRNFKIIRGLVPDLTPFFAHYKLAEPSIVDDENLAEPTIQSDEEVKKYLQFNYCIQCGLCYSACPIYSTNNNFIGPAAITVAYRYTVDSRDRFKSRVRKLDSVNGVWACRLIGACSKVCPKGVDPSLAIQLTKSILLLNL
ncbi:MAG: succinate dehydrogenase iron-sulfur subunit [Desulfurococcales archaeon]|jgi:succinate dehydrogenase / fumarate reductase iron-sulfur subunit|nr:succinate dehydrogenase iron-sulfur subunit [Desulfurococcales archaeon]